MTEKSYSELVNSLVFEKKQMSFPFMWRSAWEKIEAMPCYPEEIFFMHPEVWKMWMESEEADTQLSIDFNLNQK